MTHQKSEIHPKNTESHTKFFFQVLVWSFSRFLVKFVLTHLKTEIHTKSATFKKRFGNVFYSLKSFFFHIKIYLCTQLFFVCYAVKESSE